MIESHGKRALGFPIILSLVSMPDAQLIVIFSLAGCKSDKL